MFEALSWMTRGGMTTPSGPPRPTLHVPTRHATKRKECVECRVTAHTGDEAAASAPPIIASGEKPTPVASVEETITQAQAEEILRDWNDCLETVAARQKAAADPPSESPTIAVASEDGIKVNLVDGVEPREKDVRNESVGKATVSSARHSRFEAPVNSTSIWESLTGFAGWRKGRQLERAVAEGVAIYNGLDTFGEGEHLELQGKVGFIEAVRQRVDSSVGEYLAKRPRNSIHRSEYRFRRNALLIKSLTDEVHCVSKGKFTSDINDVRCLQLVIRQVLDGAIKDGIACPVGPDGAEQLIKIQRCQRRFFSQAVEAAYFIRDEDEDFWRRLKEVGETPTK